MSTPTPATSRTDQRNAESLGRLERVARELGAAAILEPDSPRTWVLKFLAPSGAIVRSLPGLSRHEVDLIATAFEGARASRYTAS